MFHLDFDLIKLIAYSTGITMIIFIVSAVISLCCALTIDGLQHIFLKKSSTVLAALVFILGATPELVVLFICYYGSLYLLKAYAGHYIDLSPIAAGIITLSIIYTGYILPVLQGSKQAIPQLQVKAASNLGLCKLQIYTNIILPQAMKHALPALCNLALSLIKDTSIIFLLGGKELMGITQAEGIASGNLMPFYLLAIIIYVTLCTLTEKTLLGFAKPNPTTQTLSSKSPGSKQPNPGFATPSPSKATSTEII